MGEALRADQQQQTLEQGEMTFFYRPRVEQYHPEDLGDVQRIMLLLSPTGAAYERLIVIGRKRLPRSKRRERFWGYVDLVLGRHDMQAALDAHVYGTKTRGLRHLPAARPFAWGTYDIAAHGPHSHLRSTPWSPTSRSSARPTPSSRSPTPTRAPGASPPSPTSNPSSSTSSSCT